VDNYENVNFHILNPNKYTVVEVDQLGTGHSLPSVGSGLQNAKFYKDTRAQDLVEVMIQVLDALKWEKVYLHGGSWGSALALIFAEMYPKRVIGMVLRGIFLGTQSEMDVFYSKKGAEIYKMHQTFDTIFEYAKSIGYKGGNNNSEAYVRFFRDFMLEASPESDMAAWNWWTHENLFWVILMWNSTKSILNN